MQKTSNQNTLICSNRKDFTQDCLFEIQQYKQPHVMSMSDANICYKNVKPIIIM